jgi:hypothetical protein
MEIALALNPKIWKTFPKTMGKNGGLLGLPVLIKAQLQIEVVVQKKFS